MSGFDAKSFAAGAAVAGATLYGVGKATGKLNSTPGGLFLFGVGAGAFLTYTLNRFGEREIDVDLLAPELIPADDAAATAPPSRIPNGQPMGIPFMPAHEQPVYAPDPYAAPQGDPYARRRPNPEGIYFPPLVEGALNTVVQSGARYFTDRVHNGIRTLVDQATGRNLRRRNPDREHAARLEERLRAAQHILGGSGLPPTEVPQ